MTAVLLSAVAILTLPACNSAERWTTLDSPWQQRINVEADRAERGSSEPSSFGQRVQADAPERSIARTSDTANRAVPSQLSIEDAALLALQRNRDLRVQRFGPVITGAFEKIERGVYDPQVFAELVYGEGSASETSRATGGQFAVDDEELALVAGVRQDLPTGTSVELAASEDRAYSNRSPDQHETRIGLTVTQALLDGFGPAVNLASVKQAQLDTLASLYELRGFTEALLADTEQAYWEFVFAREAIAIFERSLTLAEQQRDEVAQRIEVGVLPRTEAAAARAEVALREQALIDARTQLEVARLRLLRQMNADIDDPLIESLEPTTSPTLAPTPESDLAQRAELAQLKRPELNEARLRLDQARLETVVTRNGLLPRLDFFVTLGKSGYASAFDDAVKDISEKSYDLSVGLEFSQRLGNNTAQGRHKVAIATRQQAAAAIENLQQLIALDVRLAWAEVERARQQINATAATRTLREETLRAEQERYEVGSSTSLLVAQAQRDLLESQIDEVEAVVQYRLALIDLHMAEGSLLERRGIVMEMPRHMGR